MKLTKGIGVIVISFLLFMYFDNHDVSMIVVWFVATVLGAIALGLDVLEKRNVE